MNTKQYTLISAVSGIAASLSLLFMPLLGGGWESATGIKLFGIDSQYVPMLCKLSLALAIGCGIALAIIRNPKIAIMLGIIGVIAVLATYAIFNSAHSGGDMFSGAYVAMLAFVCSTVCNYLRNSIALKDSNQ
jgi:hypothetical protein